MRSFSASIKIKASRTPPVQSARRSSPPVRDPRASASDTAGRCSRYSVSSDWSSSSRVRTSGISVVRNTGRARELTLRVALGASRSRLVTQLLVEGVLLAVVSGAAAWLVAQWGVHVLVSTLPESTAAGQLAFRSDLRTLGFLGLLSCVSAALFTLAPAWRATRVDLTTALKDTATLVTARGTRLGLWLVGGQVALSVILLTGAGLFVQTVRNMTACRSGLRSAPSGGSGIGGSRAQYRPEEVRGIEDALLERIRAIPGVQEVALYGNTLLPSYYPANSRRILRRDGRPRVLRGHAHSARARRSSRRRTSPVRKPSPSSMKRSPNSIFRARIHSASGPGTATFASSASCAMRSCSTCDGRGLRPSIGWPSASPGWCPGLKCWHEHRSRRRDRADRGRGPESSTRASSPPFAPLTRSSPDRSHGSGWWPRPERCSVCSGSCWRAWGCSASRRLPSPGARANWVCALRSAPAAGMSSANHFGKRLEWWPSASWPVS